MPDWVLKLAWKPYSARLTVLPFELRNGTVVTAEPPPAGVSDSVVPSSLTATLWLVKSNVAVKSWKTFGDQMLSAVLNAPPPGPITVTAPLAVRNTDVSACCVPDAVYP